MNEIRAILTMAGRRLEAVSMLRAMHRAAIVVASIALVLMFADRMPGASFVAWSWVVPGLLASALLVAILAWYRRRLTSLQVALAVDDRLDLRERLSTAMHCHGRDDAFAQAALEDAVNTARHPQTRETVRRRFAVKSPARWWISPLIVAVACTAYFLPQADLFARAVPIDDELMEETRENVRDSLGAIVKIVQENDALKSELAGLIDDMSRPAVNPDDIENPEDVKRDALKKITELNRKLDDILNGEKGQTSKALKQMLAQLEIPDDGDGKDLAEALAKGDFTAAKKALERMMAKADAGELDAKGQEELAQQLGNIANQLDQLAKQQQQLQRALQQAGLNPQLANNPQALQQALQQAQNLNQQQKQQLQQMIQAQQQAQQMCQGLGQACQQMAQAMAQGNQGQMGQAAGQMGQQLDPMEQLQQMLQQAQAAANQCQGQGLGQGMAMAQAMGQGGMGGRGQGSGGTAPNQPTPWGSRLTKENVPIVAGEIIASTSVTGEPVIGESVAKRKAVLQTIAEGYDESSTEDQLPRRYHEPLKHYFGELEKKISAGTVQTEEGSGEPEKNPESGE